MVKIAWESNPVLSDFQPPFSLLSLIFHGLNRDLDFLKKFVLTKSELEGKKKKKSYTK